MPSEINPFRAWLLADRYQRQWVPVGQLGGYLDPDTLGVLVGGGAPARADVLATTNWRREWRPKVGFQYQNRYKRVLALSD